MLKTLTRDPYSASPIAGLAALASGRKFTSVVVTPARPTTKTSPSRGMSTKGFQCDVTYLWVASNIPEKPRIRTSATRKRLGRLVAAGICLRGRGFPLGERSGKAATISLAERRLTMEAEVSSTGSSLLTGTTILGRLVDPPSAYARRDAGLGSHLGWGGS